MNAEGSTVYVFVQSTCLGKSHQARNNRRQCLVEYTTILQDDQGSPQLRLTKSHQGKYVHHNDILGMPNLTGNKNPHPHNPLESVAAN